MVEIFWFMYFLFGIGIASGIFSYGFASSEKGVISKFVVSFTAGIVWPIFIGFTFPAVIDETEKIRKLLSKKD